MSAAQKDLLIKQGDSFEIFFRIRNKYYDEATQTFVPGEYKTLVGLVGKCQIKSDATSSRVLAEAAIEIPDQNVVANVGTVIMRLTPQQTAALPSSPGYPQPSLVYDLQLADDTPTPTWVKTYLEGSVAVKGQVTK